MVAVATKNATSPLHLLGGAEKLELPFKLLFPGHSLAGQNYFAMLGI
jgi:hypothetical protein